MTARLYRGTVPPPHVTEVGDGVVATIHPDGSWGLSNCGFVTDAGHVVAVDSLLTEDRTRRVLEDIRTRTGTVPEVLVNTHFHSDHTFGNFVYEDAVVVGHRACREAVLETGLSPVAKDPAVPWGDIQVRPPQITVEDSMTIHVGDRVVELVAVGPAHTRGDLVVWVPDQRVLFAGDALFHEATPIITDGSLQGAVAALHTMLALDPVAIVPGHGEVCDTGAVHAWLDYFTFLERSARAADEAGLSPLEAARELDLGRFADWQHADRIVLNLHRAMAEQRGAELGARLDSEAIFAEMIEFNPTAYGHRIVEGREQYVDC